MFFLNLGDKLFFEVLKLLQDRSKDIFFVPHLMFAHSVPFKLYRSYLRKTISPSFIFLTFTLFLLLMQTRNPGVCPTWIFHLLGYILMTRVTGYFSEVFIIQLQAVNSTRRDSEVHIMQMAAAVNLAISTILGTIMH